MQACFKPFVMFNVHLGTQARGKSGSSYENWEEIKLLLTMLNCLYDKYKPEDVGAVAIISPYSAQVRCAYLHTCAKMEGVADVGC